VKKSTCFNIPLIELAAKGKWLKPLALDFQVKAMFNHSIIYNYTPNKLAKLSGLHHKTVKRYVKKLIEKGLAVERDGNLLFVKVSKVVKGKLITLPTRPYTSFEGILDRFQYLIIMNNKAKQTYKTAVRYGKNLDSLSPRVRKKALRNAKLEQPGLESILKPVLTVRNASKLFNTSISTAYKIINNLKNKNYINLKAVVKVIGTIPKHSKYLDGSYFNSNGLLFRYLGREVQEGSYLRLNSM
jgi:transposase